MQPARARLVQALRRLGVHAVGVAGPDDALALLDAFDVDVILVSGDQDERTVELLRARRPVVMLDGDAAVERAVIEVLRALGQSDDTAQSDCS